jgi:hypothetical protein
VGKEPTVVGRGPGRCGASRSLLGPVVRQVLIRSSASPLGNLWVATQGGTSTGWTYLAYMIRPPMQTSVTNLDLKPFVQDALSPGGTSRAPGTSTPSRRATSYGPVGCPSTTSASRSRSTEFRFLIGSVGLRRKLPRTRATQLLYLFPDALPSREAGAPPRARASLYLMKKAVPAPTQVNDAAQQSILA